jgi:hypothetical protein
MKTVTLLIFLCTSFVLQAQLDEYNSTGITFPQKNRSVGITYSGLGENSVFLLGMRDSGYDGIGYYSFGITYIQSLSNRFDLETGIEYNRSKLRYIPLPEEELFDFHVSFINIPLTVRFNFWEYFFLNGGIALGVNPKMNKDLRGDKGEAGIILGTGVKYDFKNIPIGLFLNPYLKRRTSYSMLETGFRMGVVYNL